MTNHKLAIAWIGLGVMGQPMAAHLLQAGHSLTVYTRTPAKARELLAAGATWADSPAMAAANADAIFTMVGFPQEAREVILGKDGVLEGARSGTLLIDMTSTEPSLAKEIHAAAKKKGVGALDAPVSGGDVGARQATLAIMVGGDRTDYAIALPLFERLGKNIVHEGPAGTGQHTKLCNQIVIASTMIGVCEALVYARKAGLDLELMVASISKGAAGCWTLDNLAPRILNRKFDPGFFVDHFVKDMGIALDEARRMNLVLPGLELARRLYEKTQRMGYGKKGTHALMLAVEQV